MGKKIFILGFFAVILLTTCSEDNNYGNPPPIGGGNGNEPEIATLDMTFSPATLNANVGDQIKFVVGAGHTATRVDEATWNAGGNTPNGGFDFSEGTYTYIIQPTDVGTIYFVCKTHASMGMKGTITVNEPEPPSQNPY